MATDSQTAWILVLLGAVLSQAITGIVLLIKKKREDKKWDAIAGIDKDEDLIL